VKMRNSGIFDFICIEYLLFDSHFFYLIPELVHMLFHTDLCLKKQQSLPE